MNWLDNILADVGLWYLTQSTPSFIKVVGDYDKACEIKDYLENNGYDGKVRLREAGKWNEIIIDREDVN